MPKHFGKSRAEHSQRQFTQFSFADLIEDMYAPRQWYSDTMYGMCQSLPKNMAVEFAAETREMGLKPCEQGCMGNGVCIEEEVAVVLEL